MTYLSSEDCLGKYLHMLKCSCFKSCQYYNYLHYTFKVVPKDGYCFFGYCYKAVETKLTTKRPR